MDSGNFLNSRRADGFHSIGYLTVFFHEPHRLLMRNTRLSPAPLDLRHVSKIVQQVGDFLEFRDGKDHGDAFAAIVGYELRLQVRKFQNATPGTS